MPANCKWLVLVPTAMEREYLTVKPTNECRVELCGFGPIVAAARTAQLIEETGPNNILVCGIAGSYRQELQIGWAYQFQRVACSGVGVGTGNAFFMAEEMGWNQWNDSNVRIGTELSLNSSDNHSENMADLLVTVCNASSNKNDVNQVIRKLPVASAEDMEGFAVATAAALAGIPCHIIRGISNVAGNRDHATWRIAEAMQSANQLALQLMKADS